MEHLIVAEGEGGSAAIDLFGKAQPGFAATATVLYLANSTAGSMLTDRLGRLDAKTLRLFPDLSSLLEACDKFLHQAAMGTAIYLSGTMSFIGKIAELAERYGVGFRLLRTEHRGSLARRVQCVHCKTIAEEVLSDTVTCSQCSVRLFVRDHYSHRLNAFMGVSRDAEEVTRQSSAPEATP
jgi:DNA-directed RNA polymerase subunit RPC12/RpoP